MMIFGCEGNNSEYDQPDDNNPPDNDLPSTLVLNITEMEEDTLLIEWNRPAELDGAVQYKLMGGWIELHQFSSKQDVITLRVSPIPELGEITVEAWQGDSRMILHPGPDAISPNE
ncbi:hypothetical protein BST85_11135 [Aureitalea marina]|uniref:Uncharacterized protein n=2 Tax=Aureitalea marina TaxID=930804 RepID=A0A2S7KRY1_9FLAO|nr:hypothetical protein BST85_11135 [Aureitalea marina]